MNLPLFRNGQIYKVNGNDKGSRTKPVDVKLDRPDRRILRDIILDARQLHAVAAY